MAAYDRYDAIEKKPKKNRTNIVPLILLVFGASIASWFFVKLYTNRNHFGNHPVERDTPTVIIRTIPDGELLNTEDHDILDGLVRTSFVPQQQLVIGPRVKRETAPTASSNSFKSFYRDGRKDRRSLANSIDRDPINDFWNSKWSPEKIREAQARRMLQYMDPSADPCTDFYQYACGNWAESNTIPEDKTGYDTFEKLRQNLDEVLRGLLEEPVQFADESDDLTRTRDDAIVKAKLLYRSCMDLNAIHEVGVARLTQFLDGLGGWPMILPAWPERYAFDWIEMAARLRHVNNDVFFTEWVGMDVKNSNKYVIQIDQANFGLPTREYYVQAGNARYLDAYKMFIVESATILAAGRVDARQIERDADDIVRFETRLAEICLSQKERANISNHYVKMSVAELADAIPSIDWYEYFARVFAREPTGDEEVVTYSLEYFRKLIRVIADADNRVLANYAMWRFVKHRVNNLDERFWAVRQSFYRVLYGREREPPRWQTCVNHVNSNMGLVLGSMFVERYFDEISKNDTLQMTAEIQLAFKDILKHLPWLDEHTKILAVQKLAAMSHQIAYPDFILDRVELSRWYTDLNIHVDEYFDSTVRLLAFLNRKEHERLYEDVDRAVYGIQAPALVNAFYHRNKNEIIFPAGILQPPFYNRWFPKCLNYGGIGVVIGHEITHGFDDRGRLFDKHGNMKSWWNEDAEADFSARTQCLVEQYGKYTVQEVGLKIDGVSTQSENIADNGGIKQAFKAYERWLARNGDDGEFLPLINATNTQLFFLNFAQIWCGSTRPEATRSKMKTAIHSPGKYRVLGTISNFDAFADVFNCAKDSPMNPENKCEVW